MAYVIITKDLTEVKDKVAFGLTKRQMICFTLAGVVGAGSYFLFRNTLGSDIALLLLIALAAPFMLFGLYEKNGQPLPEDAVPDISCYVPEKSEQNRVEFVIPCEKGDFKVFINYSADGSLYNYVIWKNNAL